jgi:hypothetical protein
VPHHRSSDLRGCLKAIEQFDLQLAEMIVYDRALKSQELLAAESILRTRWLTNR